MTKVLNNNEFYMVATGDRTALKEMADWCARSYVHLRDKQVDVRDGKLVLLAYVPNRKLCAACYRIEKYADAHGITIPRSVRLKAAAYRYNARRSKGSRAKAPEFQLKRKASTYRRKSQTVTKKVVKLSVWQRLKKFFGGK